MTFEKLTDLFNYTDIPLLVDKYYPKNKEYESLYLEAFSEIDETVIPKNFSSPKLIIFLHENALKDGGNSSFCVIHDERGWLWRRPPVEFRMRAEIHYMTMEKYSDEEIFIRVLNHMVLLNFAERAAKRVGQEIESTLNAQYGSGTKKNSKEN